MGTGRKKLLSDEEDRFATAVHEVGHALASELRESGSQLYKVSILPRGQSLGHTAFVPEKETLNYSRENIQAMMDVAVGGRVAEELILSEGKATTGCSSDLQRATDLARRYVQQFGLDERRVFVSA